MLLLHKIIFYVTNAVFQKQYENIRDEKLQHNLNREARIILSLLPGRIDNNDYLTSEETLPSNSISHDKTC